MKGNGNHSHLSKVIQKFEEADWDVLLPDLAKYAHYKIKSFTWRGYKAQRDSILAGGQMAEDIVYEEIGKVLNGEYGWDIEAKGDLAIFLKSVIRSILSNLLRSQGNMQEQNFLEDPGQNPGSANIFISDELHPLDSLHDERLMDKILETVMDQERLFNLVDCIERDITKPSEIAKELHCSVAEVNNAKKVLKRRLQTLMNEPEFAEIRGGDKNG